MATVPIVSLEKKRSSVPLAMTPSINQCTSKPLGTCLNCERNVYCSTFCGREDGPRVAFKKESPDKPCSQAWANVLKYYFIGITEDFNGTVVTLENLYPKFFKGAQEALEDIPRRNVMKSRQEYEEPCRKTQAVLSKWLAADIEMYQTMKEKYAKLKYICQRKTSSEGSRCWHRQETLSP